MSYYLVATFSDRAQAEGAYQHLKESDIALTQIDLLGTGKKTLAEVNITDPNQVAWRQATQMLYWLIPFGFFAGFGFNQITRLSIVENGPPLLNHLIGGLFGAIASAMGGFSFGGGGLFLIDKEKTPFAKRLKAGKYLVIAQGTELLIRQASRVLQNSPSDSLQFYENTL